MSRALARNVITLNGLELPPNLQTLDGFRSWMASLPEDGPRLRPTFCRGDVFVEMSAQDYESRLPLTVEVNRVLATFARKDGRGRYFMDRSWFTHRGAGLATEPDGFFVFFESFKKGRVRVNPELKIELLGAPDMVFEVVSATSKRKDLERLVVDYARAGIREYWIADALGDEARLRILVLKGKKYVEQTHGRGGWVRSVVWRRSFRVRSFVDEAGLSDVSLDVKR